jgi:hypothetical protein
MKIKTSYDPAPIPIRNFDWAAWDDSTYDIDSCTGYGRTEQESIDDLMQQIADEIEDNEQ